jgi:hypothetical protein
MSTFIVPVHLAKSSLSQLVKRAAARPGYKIEEGSKNDFS